MVHKSCLEALQGPQKSVNNMVSEFKRRRDLVVRRLNDMGVNCPTPEGAFYVFPYLDNPEKFVSDGLEKGVVMVQGKAFGEFGVNNVRLSYATAYDQLDEAMNRLESVNI